MLFIRRALSSAVCSLVISARLPFAADNTATQALHQLFDQDWEYQMAHDPVAASELGDRRWNDQWEDLSLDLCTSRSSTPVRCSATCTPSTAPNSLPQDQVSYDVFEYNTNDYLAG